jgi:predicted GTPase
MKNEVTYAEMESAYEQFVKENEIPVILMCGKTGAGKSSLINAVANNNVRESGVIPTTQFSEKIFLDRENMALHVIDAAGYGESNRHGQRVDDMMEAASNAHIALLTIGCPDRGLEMELDFISRMKIVSNKGQNHVPFICAANKIDLAKPRAVWEPDRLNMRTPKSEKEENIVEWLAYITDILNRLEQMPVVPCAAGEKWDDYDNQYGIEKLRQQIFLMLPDAARTLFARMTHDRKVIDVRARQIILTAAISAGTAALQPFPNVPDAAIIAPIQTGMIIALAKLHGYDVTPDKALKLIGPVIGTMAGRLVFEQVVKFIPGLGSALGAAVAGTITLSLGQGYHSLMKRHIWEPEKEAVINAFKTHWDKNQSLSFNDILKMKNNAEVF